MIIITVKYDGESYVSAPQLSDDDVYPVTEQIDWFKRIVAEFLSNVKYPNNLNHPDF